jgi:hypothetical protein
MSDTAAARFSVGFRQRDGYVTRAFDGLDLGNEESHSLNGSLSWLPSQKSVISLRADYTKREGNGAPFVFAGVNERAPVPAIVSVTAGCPGATIPFLPPTDPRFGPPFVPSSNDPRCANDLQVDLGLSLDRFPRNSRCGQYALRNPDHRFDHRLEADQPGASAAAHLRQGQRDPRRLLLQ